MHSMHFMHQRRWRWCNPLASPSRLLCECIFRFISFLARVSIAIDNHVNTIHVKSITINQRIMLFVWIFFLFSSFVILYRCCWLANIILWWVYATRYDVDFHDELKTRTKQTKHSMHNVPGKWSRVRVFNSTRCKTIAFFCCLFRFCCAWAHALFQYNRFLNAFFISISPLRLCISLTFPLSLAMIS